MKTKFFPKFVLFTVIVMIFLIVGTQLLEFQPNVSSAIARYFFYAIALKFVTVFLNEIETEKILYLLKLIGAMFLLVIITTLITIPIEKIFNLDLEVKGMAAYTALILGYFLGLKFVNFFSKRLFEYEDEELDLGEDIDSDIAHIS